MVEIDLAGNHRHEVFRLPLVPFERIMMEGFQFPVLAVDVEVHDFKHVTGLFRHRLKAWPA